MGGDICEIFMSFAEILILIKIDDFFGERFLKYLAEYEEIMVVEVENRSHLEVQTKLICVNLWILYYGQMMYCYFYDEKHVKLI